MRLAVLYFLPSALLLALLFVPLSALAAEPDANALFRQGVDQLRAGNLAAAADAFTRSGALSARAATSCNLALTYDRWPAHEAEALRAYRSCADLDTTGRYRPHALERAHELELLPIRIPTPAPVAVPSDDAPKLALQPPAPVVVTPPVARSAVPSPQPTTNQPRRSHGLAIAGGLLGGAGLVCLGAAIGLEVTAQNDLDAIAARSGTQIPAGSSAESEYDSARTKSRAGIGLYAATAILGVAAVSLITVDVVRSHRDRLRVSATPTAGGAWLALSGTLP